VPTHPTQHLSMTFLKMQWISFIILGHPECWISCRMVQDTRRSLNHTPSFCRNFWEIDANRAGIWRQNLSVCFRFDGPSTSKEEIGKSLCGSRYRLDVSFSSFRWDVVMDSVRCQRNSRWWWVIPHNSKVSAREYVERYLSKSPMVLYRRPDPLVDPLQGIRNRLSLNFFTASRNVLKDPNNRLSEHPINVWYRKNGVISKSPTFIEIWASSKYMGEFW
jgi:hypothetical protein